MSLAADVTGFELTGDALMAQHPAYTGKVIVTLRLAGSPALVSLRPGALAAGGAARRRGWRPPRPALDPAAARWS